jgi:hypothetical protein
MATQSFNEQHLIDDTELRENIGHVIGNIAASHHLAVCGKTLVLASL